MKRLRAKSKISTKYQIVIPKEVRMVLKDAAPGTSVYITPINKKTIKIELADKKSWIEKYGGILPLGTFGKDPVKTIRKMRDEWDERSERQWRLTK